MSERRGVPRGECWKWPQHVIDHFVGLWGTDTAANVAKRMSTRFKTTYTRGACRMKASELGLAAESAQGFICVSAAARALEVKESTVHHMIKRLGLPTTRQGAYRMLDDATWQRLQEFYKGAPVSDVMSASDAAKRLGRSLTWVCDKARAGDLRAWRLGRKWQVSRQDVERLYWDLAKDRARQRQRAAKRSA